MLNAAVNMRIVLTIALPTFFIMLKQDFFQVYQNDIFK